MPQDKNPAHVGSTNLALRALSDVELCSIPNVDAQIVIEVGRRLGRVPESSYGEHLDLLAVLSVGMLKLTEQSDTEELLGVVDAFPNKNLFAFALSDPVGGWPEGSSEWVADFFQRLVRRAESAHMREQIFQWMNDPRIEGLSVDERARYLEQYPQEMAKALGGYRRPGEILDRVSAQKWNETVVRVLREECSGLRGWWETDKWLLGGGAHRRAELSSLAIEQLLEIENLVPTFRATLERERVGRDTGDNPGRNVSGHSKTL